MPQRTIYIKEEHQKLWEEAKKLVGDESISEIVAEGLQRVIDARKNAEGNFQRIELELDDRAIAFQGREIASTNDYRFSDHDHDHVAYITPKGNILIYTEYGDNPFRIYHVYKSVAEASKEVDDYDGEPLYPYQLLNDIAEAMGGKHFEELDI